MRSIFKEWAVKNDYFGAAGLHEFTIAREEPACFPDCGYPVFCFDQMNGELIPVQKVDPVSETISSRLLFPRTIFLIHRAEHRDEVAFDAEVKELYRAHISKMIQEKGRDIVVFHGIRKVHEVLPIKLGLLEGDLIDGLFSESVLSLGCIVYR